MSGHRRRNNQWVLPLALTATAAVATAALWWWTEHSDTRSPSERLTYDSDYDPAEEASTPPGSTSKSRSSKSKRKEAMENFSNGKKKEKLPDVREETESEREKKLRSNGKDKEKEGKVGTLKKKQEVDPSGYASGYASEGGRSRSVNGGVLSRANLVSQDEIKRYVPPVRKRSVVLVLAEKDLGRNPSDEQIFQVQRVSYIQSLSFSLSLPQTFPLTTH
jgi:hypothetical protein